MLTQAAALRSAETTPAKEGAAAEGEAAAAPEPAPEPPPADKPGLGRLPSFEEVKEPVVALGSLIALPFVSLADCAMRKPETEQWQGKSKGGTEQLDSRVSTAVELIPKAKEAEKIEAEVIGPYPVVAETVTTPVAVMAN